MNVASSEPHPLDGRDDSECYRVMMEERTVLITGRREAEDNLVKTVIQLSVALIALLAGYVTQATVSLSDRTWNFFSATLLLFGIAIAFGLAEQFWSSRAYKAQQDLLERFYTKAINSFSEPIENWYVALCQLGTLLAFMFGLVFLGLSAVIKAGENANVGKPPTSAATSASAAAATTPATSTKTAERGDVRRQPANAVGGTVNASAASKKVRSDH